jgi:pentose-5-phosphate-3-epimerase
MIPIIPAILPKSFRDLEETLERLRGVAPLIQIDLVGTNILDGHDALPLWEEFDFEIDIMLQGALGAAQACIDIGASRIIIHADSQNAREALELLQPMRADENFPISVGIALRSHDTAAALVPFENLFDFVQVMGIDRVGRQGEPPDPHRAEIALIEELRKQFPDLDIQVDGAVAPHVSELVEAGANRLVVGSAIVHADDPAAVYKAVYTEANAGRKNS